MAEQAIAEEENDDQQQDREDDHAHAGNAVLRPEGQEGQRTVEHAQPFLTDCHEEGGDDGARDGAHAAHDDDHQNVVGAGNLEDVGADGADVAGIEAAADAGEESADHEGEHLVPEQRDAHRLCGDFILADGLERAPVARGDEQGDEDEDEQRDAVAPPDVRCLGDGLEALCAVGQRLRVGDQNTDDL